MAVAGYIYVCIRGKDNKYRLSVIDRIKKKQVYYAVLEAGLEKMVMSRKRNLMITYDDKHRLAFWRHN